jgi:serine/threonine-protein kinase PpkA
MNGDRFASRVIALTGACLLAVAADAREALRVDGVPDLYQRVLTLPGAKLSRPGSGGYEAVAGAQTPVLTPYYVYDRRSRGGKEWVEVGKRPKDAAEGWIDADALETWRNQLVMQYMPRGQRQRVMFFSDREVLLDALDADDGAGKAKELITSIEASASNAPEEVVAVEPWEAVNLQQSTYLMPILEFKRASFGRFYGGNAAGLDTTLVQVAGLNLESEDAQDNSKLSKPAAPPQPEDESLKEFRTGIVFVMDTTASMGPYIQRTYDTVETIYRELQSRGNIDKVSFGLVGYRDNMDHDPGIEYVTRIYQPLTPDADPKQTLENLKKVRPASRPTRDWYEDAYAGIRSAIQEIDWEPFDARFVVLVSDAGPRPAGDPLGTVSEADLKALQSEASRNSISITTLHLLTPEGGNARDHGSAARQYRSQLGGTGDSNAEKYVAIDQGSVDVFTRQVASFAGALQSAIDQASQGRMVEREPPPDDEPPSSEPNLGDILLNEIFRAQLEYLGKERGTNAPRFYRAWAADVDLTAPRNRSLDVSVLLTKDQLNTLGSRLGEILTAFKAMVLDPEEGWAKLVALSGQLATDPGRGDFVEISESGVLPGYLATLPYKSDMLDLTLDEWVNMAPPAQRELVKAIENRLLIYQDLAQDDRIWIDLGAGDANLSVYPIPLSELP